MNRRTSLGLVALGLLWLVSGTGCNTSFGPHYGLFGYPIPVSPYHQDLMEDRFWEQERYNRVPVLEPFTPGGPTTCPDEPSDDQVMRVLGHAREIEGGLPFLHEIQRNNVRIQKEKLTDFVDPVRVMPLVGPVQLHHARFKCTVYFSEVTRVGWPIPYTTKNEDAQEVVYIDLDHLHMVGNVDPGMGGGPPTGPAVLPVNTPGTGIAPPPPSAAMPNGMPAGMTMGTPGTPQRPFPTPTETPRMAAAGRN